MVNKTSNSTKKSRFPLFISVFILFAITIGFIIFSGFYSDFLWYKQIGYSNVLTTKWLIHLVLFIVGFTISFLIIFLSIFLSYRLRPAYVRVGAQLDKYQDVISPFRKLSLILIATFIAVIGGISASNSWQIISLWWGRNPYGKSDPQYNMDISFYFFDMPFYSIIIDYFSVLLFIGFLAALFTSYLYGGLSFDNKTFKIHKPNRIIIALFLFLYLLVRGLDVWLNRYKVLSEESKLFTGAAYTQVNATIPANSLVAVLFIVVALAFLYVGISGKWRAALTATGLLLVSSFVLGTIYPWGMQALVVAPSEKSQEVKYIKRNIEMTREAYSVDKVKVEYYDAVTTTEPGALINDAEAAGNIRLIDPAVVSPTVSQLEQIKGYYRFAENLDVDRYKVDGKTQDTVMGVREINAESQSGWYNQTLVYTHGYGLVASYGNQISPKGLPVFLESGIPTKGELGKFEPRVYFGEKSPRYSIVGGEGNKDVELDYPANSSEESSDGITRTTFEGSAGPKLDSLLNKLVYAIKFQSEQIILSKDIKPNAQILYDRNPVDRVKKVAPYLTMDSNPYASVVDGKIVWIVDAYTTSDNFPYSQSKSLNQMLVDSETGQRVNSFDNINYIRNSVKATVDAYDGSVNLYAWDTEDPILKSWQKVFPQTLKPVSEISADLMSHIKYPADYFKVQREIFSKYHVEDPGSFYSNEDAWRTPVDPVRQRSELLQPPYYLTLSAGKDIKPDFSIYSTYIPFATAEDNRSVLTGYLSANSNAGNTKGKISSDYGKLRLLSLPKGNTIPGPGQVQNNFTTDSEVSKVLNILSNGGNTEVINGNLLTLPIGGGLLYVQPVYVKSTSETSYPDLQKILVAIGDKIAFEDTLSQALDSLFGGNTGVDLGDNNPSDSENNTNKDDKSGDKKDQNLDTLDKALKDMEKALEDQQKAMADGDWSAYGEAGERLRSALQRALEQRGSE